MITHSNNDGETISHGDPKADLKGDGEMVTQTLTLNLISSINQSSAFILPNTKGKTRHYN